MTTVKVQDQKVQFLKGEFTPLEAKDMIYRMIDEQINQYKLQHLSRWEHDHNTSVEAIDQKIENLKRIKQEFAEMIRQAREENCQVNLSGMLIMNIKK